MFGSTRVHFQSSELRAALSAAEARVVARLEQRPTLSTSEIIARMEIPDEQKDQADRLLLALSNVLGVSPGKLRHDDILAELLGVDGDELTADQAAVIRKNGSGSRIEVFWYKLFDAIQSVTDGKVVSTQVKNFVGHTPKGEDGYIDLMRSLRLARLIRLLSPAVRL